MPNTPLATTPHYETPTAGLLAQLARLHHTVMVVDTDDRVVWLSDEMSELCGGRAQIGATAANLFGSRDRHQEIRERVARQGFLANEPIGLLTADVAEVPVELTISQVPGSCSKGLMLAVVRPVEAADAARCEVPGADYFQCILDSSSDAIVAMDRHGYVTYANPSFVALLGISPERLRGLPIAVAFARRAELNGLADAFRPPGEGRGVELQVTRSDGDVRVLSVSSNPVVLPDGARAGTVAFLRDVTEQRRSEAALEVKNQELEHYVHAVSHDLRTPLVSMLGFSRLLAQDYGDVLTDTGRHFLERIEQASRTMESLINDLLELSRIGSHAAPRDWVDPLPVLKQLASELKPGLDEAGIELVLPTSPPLVPAVRTQLYQVFSNLVGNAIEHMGVAEGGRIDVAVRDLDDAIVLEVTDNGVGIPPDEHDRVFEIFHTLRRDPAARRGTGIGLAIVKKIAETHGGRVWLESQEGQGARFSIALPRP